jgi:hypothetical protein
VLPHIASLGTPHQWLVVPYAGPELAIIEIGIGGRWVPAYLDHEDGQRVAMIRHDGVLPGGQLRVRAGGQIVGSWDLPRQPRGGIIR